MNRPKATWAMTLSIGSDPQQYKQSVAEGLRMGLNMPRRVLAALVLGYQRWISPWFPARCRFYPSCSQYALQALERYGALKGSWMALKRLVRCGPWSRGGYDPLK